MRTCCNNACTMHIYTMHACAICIVPVCQIYTTCNMHATCNTTYRGFFDHFARVVESSHTSRPIPLLYSPQLLKKLQDLHGMVASGHPGWSPYRFPSTGHLAILLAINLCETPPDLYGFFPSERSAFDMSHGGAVGYGDLSHIPFQNNPHLPRESSMYRPRDLYEFHSLTLEYHVLEYLEGAGAVKWHKHDNSKDSSGINSGAFG